MKYYSNKRKSYGGSKFRSNDEILFNIYCEKLKAKEKIVAFEYETEKIVLQNSFRFKGKFVHAITYKPDFILYHNDGSKEYIEIKGHLTHESVLKVKMFKLWLTQNEPEAGYRMLSRSLKYGTIDGEWIEYDELKKIRAKNSKKASRGMQGGKGDAD